MEYAEYRKYDALVKQLLQYPEVFKAMPYYRQIALGTQSAAITFSNAIANYIHPDSEKTKNNKRKNENETDSVQEENEKKKLRKK